MDRQEIILQHIDKSGIGLEIGPSHSPVAPKKEGYQVHIIDHLDQAGLQEKYREANVCLENIEEVDYVWNGEDYATLTGKKNYYDWIIASHIIEHTPDMISFLNGCDAVLKDGGMVSLVVPDKRYCFDRFRPISGLGKVIDNHFRKETVHSPGSVAESWLNNVSKSGGLAWDANTEGSFDFIFSTQNVKDGMNAVMDQGHYVDVHAWCFVPHSFRLMMLDLYTLGLIPFQEVDFHPTVGSEFYVTLGKGAERGSASRMEMLRAVDQELAEGMDLQVVSTNVEKEQPFSSEVDKTLQERAPGIFRRAMNLLQKK